MNTSLGRVIVLVDDYDKAFEFYQKNFFCTKLFDSTSPSGQRFLHVAFADDDDTGIWFLKADTPEQQSAIGQQTAGQPMLVIYTQKIERLFVHLKQNGVTIIGELVSAPGSKYFHCFDLYGNRLTVVELLT